MSNLGFLDKAVHHFCGVLPEHLGKCNFLSLRVGNGGIYAPYYVTHEMEEDTICSREEFQQRARELGYGAETISVESTEWYDYTNQKALRLPPVGVECEMLTCNKWELIKMVGFDDGFAVVKYLDDKSYHGQSGLPKFYRPLDHAARKAEAERKRVVDAAQRECVNFSSNDLGRLYDAGFLRMPEDK
jgi:hypothetical protein